MSTLSTLSTAELAQLRSTLTARLRALALTDPETPEVVGDLPVSEVETAPADKATVRLLNDMALEAADHHSAQMALLRHALAKFDDDSYGLCEECGQAIGVSRLQARPEARLCIACQTRAERR